MRFARHYHARFLVGSPILGCLWASLSSRSPNLKIYELLLNAVCSLNCFVGLLLVQLLLVLPRCQGCEVVLSSIEEQVSRANQHKEQQLGLKQQIESEVRGRATMHSFSPPSPSSSDWLHHFTWQPLLVFYIYGLAQVGNLWPPVVSRDSLRLCPWLPQQGNFLSSWCGSINPTSSLPSSIQMFWVIAYKPLSGQRRPVVSHVLMGDKVGGPPKRGILWVAPLLSNSLPRLPPKKNSLCPFCFPEGCKNLGCSGRALDFIIIFKAYYVCYYYNFGYIIFFKFYLFNCFVIFLLLLLYCVYSLWNWGTCN